jgi:hypothetical protein
MKALGMSFEKPHSQVRLVVLYCLHNFYFISYSWGQPVFFPVSAFPLGNPGHKDCIDVVHLSIRLQGTPVSGEG